MCLYKRPYKIIDYTIDNKILKVRLLIPSSRDDADQSCKFRVNYNFDLNKLFDTFSKAHIDAVDFPERFDEFWDSCLNIFDMPELRLPINLLQFPFFADYCVTLCSVEYIGEFS